MNDVGYLDCDADVIEKLVNIKVVVLPDFDMSIVITFDDIRQFQAVVHKISYICTFRDHFMRRVAYETGTTSCEALLFEFFSSCIANVNDIDNKMYHMLAVHMLRRYEKYQGSVYMSYHTRSPPPWANSTELLVDTKSPYSLASQPPPSMGFVIYFPFDVHCSVLGMMIQKYPPPSGMKYNPDHIPAVRQEWRTFVDNMMSQLHPAIHSYLYIGMVDSTYTQRGGEAAGQCRVDLEALAVEHGLSSRQDSSSTKLAATVASLLPDVYSVIIVEMQTGNSYPEVSFPMHSDLDAYMSLLEVARTSNDGQVEFFVLLPAATEALMAPHETLLAKILLSYYVSGLGVYGDVSSECEAQVAIAGTFHPSCANSFLCVSRQHLELSGGRLLPLSLMRAMFSGVAAPCPPLSLLALALQDVYRPWQNFMQLFNNKKREAQTESGMDPLANTLWPPEQTRLYMLEIAALRLVVAPLVTSSYYAHGKQLVWSPQTLAYGGEGTFYVNYCSRSVGCDYEERGSSELHPQVVDVAAWDRQVSPKEEATGARIAFVTAIIGHYESKYPFVPPQSVPTDFYCFRGGEAVADSDSRWIVDNYPYHLDPLYQQAAGDNGTRWNSYTNNQHSFMVAKFYKMNFYLFPRLKKYDVIVWIDGSLNFKETSVSASVLRILQGNENIAMFELPRATLRREATLSAYTGRYLSTHWAGQNQPLQDIEALYRAIVLSGYDEMYWRRVRPDRPLYGMWVTCFVAFKMTDTRTHRMLYEWYQHTLEYTQDQMTLSLVLQQSGIHPYSLPDGVYVNGSVRGNDWFVKNAGHG